MSEIHVVSLRSKRKVLKPISYAEIQRDFIEGEDGLAIDSQHQLISMLLPPAVRAFLVEV